MRKSIKIFKINFISLNISFDSSGNFVIKLIILLNIDNQLRI